MQLEAIGQPIRYRLKTGEEVTLRPGVPLELPDLAASQLLQKAPDKVRRVEPLSTVQPGDLMTWQRANGLQSGPAMVDFLHSDQTGTVWAFVTLSDGSWAAVNLKYALTQSQEGR